MSILKGPIPLQFIGESWPAVRPSDNSADCGRAWLESSDPVVIRSFQSIALFYEAGRLGIDDSGGIVVVGRMFLDGGHLQTHNPRAENYVTAKASNGCALELVVDSKGHVRPWMNSLRIRISRGCLYPGDSIRVTLGDRSRGSPGMKMQSCCESAHEFRVLVDACATGLFEPVVDRLTVPIVPGEGVTWKAVLPSLRRHGSEFCLGIKREDVWGNPAFLEEETLLMETRGCDIGLPKRVVLPAGKRAARIQGLKSTSTGVTRVDVFDNAGQLLAHSNPLVFNEQGPEGYWGDIHGQSGETVGINSAEEYLTFGRDLAFLDVIAHQGNDFQIKPEFWSHLNDLVDELNVDHRFVAIPGYEWSGNTSVGGDHNVYFQDSHRPIRRSSLALLSYDDCDPPVFNTDDLFKALKSEDCVVISHVGGRPADISKSDGGTLRTAVEVHSDWGTFEWILIDSFRLGYRLGIVCNSDGHKGRPGASYPGSSHFGALGGLTCFLAEELSRNGIFQSLKRRRHYGTTGCRLYMNSRVKFAEGAKIFVEDPKYGNSDHFVSDWGEMGDIALTPSDSIAASIEIVSHSPILSIQCLNGEREVGEWLGYSEHQLGNRIRVTFHGAEYRGRGRQTSWSGLARITGGKILRVGCVNVWNPERIPEVSNDESLDFEFVTTGNFTGFDLNLECLEDARLDLLTNRGQFSFDLEGLGMRPSVFELGGLEREIRVSRLPDKLEHFSVKQSFHVELEGTSDNPIWFRVNTEDGHLAWPSPIYIIPDK